MSDYISALPEASIPQVLVGILSPTSADIIQDFGQHYTRLALLQHTGTRNSQVNTVMLGHEDIGSLTNPHQSSPVHILLAHLDISAAHQQNGTQGQLTQQAIRDLSRIVAAHPELPIVIFGTSTSETPTDEQTTLQAIAQSLGKPAECAVSTSDPEQLLPVFAFVTAQLLQNAEGLKIEQRRMKHYRIKYEGKLPPGFSDALTGRASFALKEHHHLIQPKNHEPLPPDIEPAIAYIHRQKIDLLVADCPQLTRTADLNNEAVRQQVGFYQELAVQIPQLRIVFLTGVDHGVFQPEYQTSPNLEQLQQIMGQNVLVLPRDTVGTSARIMEFLGRAIQSASNTTISRPDPDAVAAMRAQAKVDKAAREQAAPAPEEKPKRKWTDIFRRQG